MQQPALGVVEIIVSDNGKGVTADQAQHALELFHQNSDLDRASAGLGIGLALVRQLVELQGRTVRACCPGLWRGTSIILSVQANQPSLAHRVATVSCCAKRSRGDHAA